MPMVRIANVRKAYATGFEALKGVSLDIHEGEILALLGPNGAGKTTLISTICGITQPTSGTITVGGYDVVTAYRGARSLIGLVPQEINLETFERVLVIDQASIQADGPAAEVLPWYRARYA